jgi:predicted RNase H-like HicB family nuclease
MALPIEIEQEDDGRWLAEIPDLPGVMAYGPTREAAAAAARALALRVLADRIEHGEEVPEAVADLFAVRTEFFRASEQRILSKTPALERPSANPGSRQAVLKHFGVFKDDADLDEQLAGLRARRDTAGE